jgi:hypothetical protein
MTSHFEFEGITVTWDEPSNAAMVVFHGYVEGKVLREALDKVLEVLVAKGSSRLISDGRGMKALRQEDQLWIDEDWRPRARTAGLRLNAVLLPASAVATLSVKAIVRRVPSELTRFAYFNEIDEARAWFGSTTDTG